MTNDLMKVNTASFAKSAKALDRAAPKILRAVKKEMREAAKPLGKSMTAGLAPSGAYPNGLGDRLRRGNYTKLRFLRNNTGVQLVLRLAVRHPVYADPEKTRADWSWVNQPLPERDAPAAFDKGVDDLQNKIANATTKALKETL